MHSLMIHAPQPVDVLVPMDRIDWNIFVAWMRERSRKVLGLDSETNAIDPFDAGFRCRAIQVADSETAWVLPVEHLTDGARRAIHDHPRFVAHFSQSEIKFMGRGAPGTLRIGELEPHIWDCQIPQAIADPRTLLPRKDGVDIRLQHAKGLKDSYDREVSSCLSEAEDALHAWFRANAPKGSRTPAASRAWGFANVPFLQPEYLTYSAMDAVAVRVLFDHYQRRVVRMGTSAVAELNRELILQWDIDNMTYRGLPTDAAYVLWLRDQLEATVAEEATALLPYGIPRSGQGQSVNEAFERLGVPALKASQRTGKPSWDRDALLVLIERHPGTEAASLAQHVLNVRRASKFRTNYVQPMLDALGRDGRVHCSFRSIGTVTHRNSAQEPPLQQLPKKDPRIRAAFGGLDGWSVVTCDLAQGEPRVMAGLSGDPEYVAAVNSGDVNSVAARAAYGDAYDAADGKTAGTPSYLMRQSTKAGFLSVCYAAGEDKLAKIMGLPVTQVRAIRDNWKRVYAVMFGRAARLNQQEFVTLPSGRAVILWDRKIVMPDGSIVTSARPSRKALNYETQGFQADLLKAAWLTLRTKWHWALSFLLHDEIMLLVPDALAEEAAADLQSAMTFDLGHGVTMLSEPTVEGRTWMPQPEAFGLRGLDFVDA